MNPRIHPTAIVEDSSQIGEGTSIWDNAHIRGPSLIGCDCIIGGKSYVAYGVEIGDRVKVNANVYIPTGVIIETGVMISAGTIFTNDRFPRATTPDLRALRSSDPSDKTLNTIVREGATIGAGCKIGPGIEIGRFAMIGMGSIVTKNVPAFFLVAGTPAKAVGVVCRCGEPVFRGDPAHTKDSRHRCPECARVYLISNHSVQEIQETTV